MLRKWVVLSVLCVATGLFPFAHKAWANGGSYTFGIVPQYEVHRLAAIWLPILTELEKKTDLKFKMVGTNNIPDFENHFMAGDFDFAYMNPYHSRLALKNQGYKALVRDDENRLYGILVAKKDGGIDSVEQLNGKSIAFPAPNALGASLIIRADLDQLCGISFTPHYVQTHSSVYLNVALGKEAAGGGVMGSFSTQQKEIRDKLKIIYETRTMAPHPVVAHPRVPEEHRERVRRAFLEIGETPQGAELLAKIPITKITAADSSDYEELDEWGLEKYVE